MHRTLSANCLGNRAAKVSEHPVWYLPRARDGKVLQRFVPTYILTSISIYVRAC